MPFMIYSDDEEIQHIDIDRDERGFGFGFRGGAEYNAPLCVLRIADHGAAMNDGRLRVRTQEWNVDFIGFEHQIHGLYGEEVFWHGRHSCNLYYCIV